MAEKKPESPFDRDFFDRDFLDIDSSDFKKGGTKMDRSLTALPERLYQALPIAKMTAQELRSKKKLVEVGIKSIEQIGAWRQEILKFLDAVLLSTIDNRSSGGMSDANKIARLKAKTNIPAMRMPTASTIDAEMIVNCTVEDIRDHLDREMKAEIVRFEEDLYSILDGLVRSQLAGSIEWLNESVCKFRHYRRIVQDTERAVRCSVQLMNASEKPLPAADTPIPERIKELLGAIPSWLGSKVRVVTGDCLRVDISESDPDKPELAVQQHTVFNHIAAVVLDDCYVLTGWDQNEALPAAEQHKKAKKEAVVDGCWTIIGLILGLYFIYFVYAVIKGVFFDH